MKARILITGGAGFIGSNIARYFADHGYIVTIFDNLSRLGTKENAKWLLKSKNIRLVKGDIRNYSQIKNTVKKGFDGVFHLAAQVAVTTSVNDPRSDFDINALGTFNVMEAVRESGTKPLVIYSSTNKVYGGMESVKIIEKNGQYAYRDFKKGISEKMPLDFHSPYGCSKGSADQYVRDYERIYDIPAVVFRQSCIYGPRQFGVEDQGWIAWFIIALTLGKKIVVYGDGKQVRDVLYIEDLVRLFEKAFTNQKVSRGKIYNVGGGSRNTLAVWAGFGPILERLFKKEIKVKFEDWRPGDQKVYVSDISFVTRELKWKPEIGAEYGIEKLFGWIQKNKELFNIFR